MIQLLRSVFVENIVLKVFAFVIAVLIWSTATFLYRGDARGDGSQTIERDFRNRPVAVVSGTEDVYGFKVRPSTVELTLRGEAETLRRLEVTDVTVMVDLTGWDPQLSMMRKVLVSVPLGVAVVRVNPSEVEVVLPDAP